MIKKKLFTSGIIFTSLLIAITTNAGTTKGNITRGALLYDNWPVMTNQTTEGTHKLYPKDSKKVGPSSWRCKECHGWDYLGKEGRYNKGSHFTGIKGVFSMNGKSADSIRKALTELKDHNFGENLSDKDLASLVLFLQKGMIDVKKYIDKNEIVKGDPKRGKALYYRNCSSCHWGDGKLIDINKKAGVQGVGYAANDNPQETLHKIRWGHPGSDMPSAVVDGRLYDQETVDILAYIKTLK